MNRPGWVSPSLYPFESNYFGLDEWDMHYVDEGVGDPVLLVHGNPTWSFLYRTVITDLSDEYRLIAPDHLGFGLSDKPGGAAYRPADHARRLTEFIEWLELDQFTLVVHDFGGPIGLPYAIEHPDMVSGIVLCNTWLWSLEGDRAIRLMDRLVRGILGRVFYTWFNGSPRVILKMAWGATELADEVHRHYTGPFPSPEMRFAPLILARELLGSTDWYEKWWDERNSVTEIPAILLWGLKDPAFGESYLDRWETNLLNPTVRRYPDTGHFVPDEAGERVVKELRRFLSSS